MKEPLSQGSHTVGMSAHLSHCRVFPGLATLGSAVVFGDVRISVHETGPQVQCVRRNPRSSRAEVRGLGQETL